jgi:hypothetical protein
MKMFTKIMAGAAGLAAFAAAPAAAQYGYGYNQSGYNGYQYGAPYGNAYGYYGQNNMTNLAVQQCTAAVQSRLSSRVGLSGILGGVLGVPVATGRVLSVTRVDPRDNATVRVRGLANSGTSPYGYGAYGATGYGYQPDLSFKCDVDYRGRVRDIDINRRR